MNGSVWTWSEWLTPSNIIGVLSTVAAVIAAWYSHASWAGRPRPDVHVTYSWAGPWRYGRKGEVHNQVWIFVENVGDGAAYQMSIKVPGASSATRASLVSGDRWSHQLELPLDRTERLCEVAWIEFPPRRGRPRKTTIVVPANPEVDSVTRL